MKEHGVWTMDIPDTCGRKEFQFAGYAEPNVTIRETPEFQRLAADSDVIRGVDEFEDRHIGLFTEFSTEEGETVEFKAADFTRRTIFSGWNVFRSEMPLLSIIEPDVVNDCLESLVTLAEESGNGYLERWELLNGYTGCMVGNPAVSVLADMYLKGLYRHDIARAYAMADSTSRKIGKNVYLQRRIW